MSEATLFGNEQDHVKRLKRELEGWREIVLQMNSVLLWEKNWYPGVLAGASTILFMLLWLAEPSLLSAVSCAGLLITLLDYLVPTLSATMYNPALWTGAQEKQFENICRTLVQTYATATHQLVAFKDLKLTSPKLYYSVTIFSLTLLAYIGNKVNNLLLTYLIVTAVLLLPGLSHHGLLHKYYQLILQNIANVLKSLQGGAKIKAN
ncbi:ADP-ribosylation factor-like protein 6-interacting protein 1 [Macrosteles quadrilineatus]|uniref:ADP-ribosylation factor-like protein 6-interacting protein 1 n=1 Tax=Macrosteles quadrilineatus TaxID=74068 RepID=UPI0023E17F23|nr:ADP-ribosylation factor-like protein 6-interacting protein 1 [Macrosteles quadrilineatus]